MEDKSLESKIERLKEQAFDRSLSFKIARTATILGKKKPLGPYQGYDEHNFKYVGDGLELTDISGITPDLGDGGLAYGSTEAKYRGKQVFYCAGSGVEKYLPGKWEKKLELLYGKAEEILSKQRGEETNKKLEKERKEARRNFGIK